MPSLLSGPKTPATPAVAVAPPMPDQSSPQVIEAQDKAAIQDQQRAGRASTVLGRQATPTGADSFSAPKLGSGT